MRENYFSALTWFVDVGETNVDGDTSYVVKKNNDEAGQVMQNKIQSFVEYYASEKLYDEIIDGIGIDKEIAYGWAHTSGNIVDSALEYGGITILTVGAATVALSGLEAVGESAEKAHKNGATFNQTILTSPVSWTLGTVSGGIMDKLGAASNLATKNKVFYNLMWQLFWYKEFIWNFLKVKEEENE